MDAEGASADDMDFYLVVIFKSHEKRKEFTDACGLEDNRYVNGDEIDAFIFEDDEEEGGGGKK